MQYVFIFPVLAPKTTTLRLFNDSVSNIRFINNVLLLSKFYIFKSRNKHWLNINELLANIHKIKQLEKVTAFGNVSKVAVYVRKWDIINRKLLLLGKVRFKACILFSIFFNLQRFYSWKLWILYVLYLFIVYCSFVVDNFFLYFFNKQPWSGFPKNRCCYISKTFKYNTRSIYLRYFKNSCGGIVF